MTILADVVDWLSIAYLVCFFLGVAYSLVAFFFGGHGGSDVSGHDVSIGADLSGGATDLGGGHDVVVGHDATAAEVGGHIPGDISTQPGFSPMSPPVIAMTLVTFGGTGIIFTQFFRWEALSLIPSSVSGITMGVLTFLFFYKIFASVQGSSSPSLGELIGIEAETCSTIPSVGVGEIAYIARGARFTARAKSISGQSIPQHAAVTIVRWVGNTAQVKPVSEESAAGSEKK